MRLSNKEVRVCFQQMMWDIYQKLAPEVQRILNEVLRKYETENDIEMWLLTVIGMFNIVWKINAGANFDIPKNTEDVYDFVKSSPDYEMLMFWELFEQVDHYRNNGKLQPPEMITVWNIEVARREWREVVRTVLDQIK